MHVVRKGDIIGDLYIPSEDNNRQIGLVYLPGLPNHPGVEDMGQPLADQGFTVVQIRYPGSWHSYGTFNPTSSLEGAQLGLELLADGQAVDLRTLAPLTWNVDQLVLVGNSYGGAIAVTALATIPLADAAVALCPLLDPTRQNEDPDLPEEDLTAIFPFIKRGFENIFRGFDEKEFQAFIQGKHICHPVDYLSSIEKPLYILHGTEDRQIRAYHSKQFFDRLVEEGNAKSKLSLVEGVGHGRELRTSTQDDWLAWITNKKT